MNIAMLLQMAAESAPDRNALTHARHHYTYGQIFQAAQVAAGLFRASGCQYVSVLDVSSPAVPIALFGAAMAGVAYVPLNYRLTREELDALIERVTPVYMVADDRNHEAYAPRGVGTVIRRAAFLEQTLGGTPDGAEPAEDPTAVAVQLFTSGTTGKPKAAILRHEHLVSYILGSVEFMAADEAEATLVSVPPYHIAGISAVLSSIYACRRIVQLPDFGAASWLEHCEHDAVTNAFVVPTMLSRIIDHLDTIEARPHLPALKAIAYGGGKMPQHTIERALAMFPQVDFTNAYGLTETSSTICLLGPQDHREAFQSGDPAVRRRLSSVGKPLPSVELEVRDDDGRALGANEAGEIYVRGPQVSGEYLERRAIRDDGWFPTRDAGFVDEHGYLYLSGRADDVIIRGAENISPGEIEDVLLTHPLVADACAVGIPSEEWGETVAAAVVLKPDTEVKISELQHLVRDKLRSSRVPEQVRFVKGLPYNEMGKLLRREVKTLFA
ncbi:MAG: class I adenylate-forming enzyme family protein [Gammaproteobacteria bacterium]